MCLASAIVSCKSQPEDAAVPAPEAEIIETANEEMPPPPILKVEPLDLLKDGAAFYMAIPKQADAELLRRMILCGMPNLGEEAVTALVARLDVAYAALERRYNDTLLEMTAKCTSSAVEYDFPAAVSFPVNEVGLLAADSAPLVALYEAHARGEAKGHRVQDAVYAWLSGRGRAGDGGHLALPVSGAGALQIRFYALRPQSFLTILVGARLNFKFEWIRGYLYPDPALSSQYIMALDAAFKDESAVLEGRTALETAFSLTGGAVYMSSPTVLTITGIKISRRQLYKLFVL